MRLAGLLYLVAVVGLSATRLSAAPTPDQTAKATAAEEAIKQAGKLIIAKKLEEAVPLMEQAQNIIAELQAGNDEAKGLAGVLDRRFAVTKRALENQGHYLAPTKTQKAKVTSTSGSVPPQLPNRPMLVLPSNHRYAFMVGVRQYEKTELTNLTFTENDITELTAVLLRSGYRKENVVTMTQTLGALEARFAPFARNIRRELALLLNELTPADTVVLAFSGHGVQFQGDRDCYFCPADAKLSDRETLVSLGEVYSALDTCNAGAKVLLVDACRNDPQSNLSKSARKVVNLETVTKPQAIALPGGINAMFSCSAGQQSFENPDLKHGVFFHYVILGLSGAADLDKDNEVTLAELEQFSIKGVQSHVRSELGQSQTPERRGESRGLVTLTKLQTR